MAVKEELRRKSDSLGDPKDEFLVDLIWHYVGGTHTHDPDTDTYKGEGGEWRALYRTAPGAGRASVMLSYSSRRQLNNKGSPQYLKITKNRTVTRYEREAFDAKTCRLIVPGYIIDVDDPDLEITTRVE